MLDTLKPNIFSLQETHYLQTGMMKVKGNFTLFELVRKNKEGGGLALGVDNNLYPALLREGDDDVEALTVELWLNDDKPMRAITAYGPQENDNNMERKHKFWEYLQTEVTEANNEGIPVVIQFDANSWLGDKIIPGDPHSQNKNGKLFQEFLERNAHLTVVNSLSICEGLITRRRKTTICEEKSIIDFFVVCNIARSFISKMIIDEDRQYSLTNYQNVNKNGKITQSDHEVQILEFDIKFPQIKKTREEFYNFKNVEGQIKFKQLSDKTSRFTNCFSDNDLSVSEQVKQWNKCLDSFCQQSFKKVRKRRQSTKETKMSKLFEKKRTMKVNKSPDRDISEVEKEIAQEIAAENAKVVSDNFQTMGDATGSLNINSMWGLKNKIYPKKKPSLPTGKRNKKGNIITHPKGVKKLTLDHIKHRLRHRPIKPTLVELGELQDELFKIRLARSKLQKSKPWTKKQLMKILRSLKTNKSKDPHGLVNQLFKENVAGSDMIDSLLIMMNKIKQESEVPESLRWANISLIYKGKGERVSLDSDRGIFVISILRTILMRLIYEDNNELLDSEMSDSQVGARKGRNIRNHLFILYSVIQDVLNKKSNTPIEVILLDYKLCFDGMKLSETLNDIYNCGLKDDKFSLLYETNKQIDIAVNTPYGLTERESISEIVAQGDVFSPSLCAVQVDTHGKLCLENYKHLYQYKGEVGLPPLAMIDDLLLIQNCGYKSAALNAYINARTSTKSLQYGVIKCKKIHIGKRRNMDICSDISVDAWEVQEVTDIHTGLAETNDIYIGKDKIESTISSKYLGDIVSGSGNNEATVAARVSRGTGIVNEICQLLHNIYFGKYFFQTAIIYRNSLLISSLLTNCETWQNLRQKDIFALSKVDQILLRKILSCPQSTPVEMIFGELGLWPVEWVIRSQRLSFLKYILEQEEESLVRQVFEIQHKLPTRTDFCTVIKSDIEILQLNLTFQQIEEMSLSTFKRIVKEKTNMKVLEWINGKKS